jgi:hypothetical protein
MPRHIHSGGAFVDCWRLDAPREFRDHEQHDQCKRQDYQHDPNKWMCIFWRPDAVPTAFYEHGTNCKSGEEQPQPRRAFRDEDATGLWSSDFQRQDINTEQSALRNVDADRRLID